MVSSSRQAVPISVPDLVNLLLEWGLEKDGKIVRKAPSGISASLRRDI